MSWLVAATGSFAIPSDRASTFAEPPGTTATAGTGPAGPEWGTRAAEQAVDHPAHRAVAAVHDDQVDSVGNCLLREFGPMTTVVGVLDGELEAALERVCQQIASGRSGGSGCWVHNQHGTHDRPA